MARLNHDGDDLMERQSWQSLETNDIPGCHQIKENKALKTVWTIVVAIVVQVVLVLSAFLVQWYCTRDNFQCYLSALSITLYVHIGAWFFTLTVHLCLRHQHLVSRRHGYGAFYRQTTHLRRMQFYVLSIGNAILFAMLTIMHDLSYCGMSDSMSTRCIQLFTVNLIAIYWVQLIVSIETLICLPTLIIYLVRTVEFNNLKLRPDIFRESPLTPDTISARTIIGFRGKSLVEETIERQFESIDYLTARCEFLTQLLSRTSDVVDIDVIRNIADVSTLGDNDTSLLLTD